MPILFKTQNKSGSVAGIGIFALEDIPKGSVWWTCDNTVKGEPCLNAPNLDNIVLDEITFKEFESKHSKEELSAILEHTMHYEDGNQIIVLRDGAGPTNHSFEPNSQTIYNPEKDYRKLKSIAIKDIKAGDEITQNYGTFIKKTNNWVEDVFRKYVPSRLEFQENFNIKKIEH